MLLTVLIGMLVNSTTSTDVFLADLRPIIMARVDNSVCIVDRQEMEVGRGGRRGRMEEG